MDEHDSTRADSLTKICFKCREVKSLDYFHRNAASKDGWQASCIPCSKAMRKPVNPVTQAAARAEKHKAAMLGVKTCKSCNVEKALNSTNWVKSTRGLGGYVEICKDCQADRRWERLDPMLKERRVEADRLQVAGKKCCPCCNQTQELAQFIKKKSGGVYSYCLSCYREQSRAKRTSDLEADRKKKRESMKRRLAHPVAGVKLRAVRNKLRKHKRNTDPVYALEERIRGLIGSSVKRMGYTKRARTYEILGCSFDVFAAHLERQFIKGMTWGNRSDWHIDHIQPMASAKTEADVIALNHFTNLRPLWAADNLAKSDTITHLI
jgi:Uri superfamily endonuclease